MVKTLCCFFLLFTLPLIAKPKTCRLNLLNAETRTLHRYPSITRDFAKALNKAIPAKEDSHLAYFLSTHYNAVIAASSNIPPMEEEGLPLKVLSKLPYALQIEFFTRLKHHPFLRETPPESLELVSKGGTPQYLSREHREVLLKLLAEYDLPDIEGNILKLAPIEKSDIEGATLEVFYSSNTRDLIFLIDLADDGTAVAHADGQIFTAGAWRLENGFLKIDGQQKIQLDLNRATYSTLNEAHTAVARIHEWGPYALIQVRRLISR